MISILTSNRRKTSRDNLKIKGTVIIKKNDVTYTESIDLINVSYEGIQIAFSNNNFLFKYLEFFDIQEGNIFIEFIYESENYIFQCNINWLKLYDIGEKNFYTVTSLGFININQFEDKLVELIILLKMQSFHLK